MGFTKPSGVTDFITKEHYRDGLYASSKHIVQKDFSILEALNLSYGTVFSDGLTVRIDSRALEHTTDLRLSEGLRLLILMALSFGCKYLYIHNRNAIWKEIPTYV
jgi:hypothetical protein